MLVPGNIEMRERGEDKSEKKSKQYQSVPRLFPVIIVWNYMRTLKFTEVTLLKFGIYFYTFL